MRMPGLQFRGLDDLLTAFYLNCNRKLETAKNGKCKFCKEELKKKIYLDLNVDGVATSFVRRNCLEFSVSLSLAPGKGTQRDPGN